MGVTPFILSAIAQSIQQLLEKYLTRDGLTLGMNATGVANWSSGRPFANMMHYGYKWDVYGTQTPTALAAVAGQQQGLLTTTLPSDQFYMIVNDVPTANGSPNAAGTYTVLNPDGLLFKIFIPGGTDYTTWSTSARVTFNYTTGRMAIAVQGSVTNTNGNLAIIVPGHETSWNQGNIWNSEFLDFYRTGNLKMLRAMDILNSMWRLDSEWTERSLPGKLTFNPRITGNSQAIVPWEHVIDLASRLNIPLMINVPVRASASYVTQLATLFAQQYPSNLQLYVEGVGNEIWNTASSFQNATRWIEYFDYTRIVAALDYTTGTVTLANHGLVTNDHIMAFQDASDWGLSANGNIDTYWYGASRGEDLIVEVIDTNSFKMRYWPSTITPKPLLTFTTYPKSTVTFIKLAEAGKSPVLDINYSTICQRNWAIFDAAIGRNKCVHVLGSQAVNASTTSARLAVTNAATSTDVVAIAPYFNGAVFGIKLTPVAGGVTPEVWSFTTLGKSKADAYAAIFPSGTTPTASEIKSAASVSALLQFSLSSTGYNAMPTLSATDGSQVNVWVTTKIDSEDIVLSGAVTVGSGQASVEVQPTFTDQAKRMREGILVNTVTSIKVQALAAGSIPLMCYECGSHNDVKAPASIMTWHTNYMHSTEHASVLREYLTCMSQWIKVANWFADVGIDNADTTCWAVATSYKNSDWSVDTRFNSLKLANGYISRVLPLQIETPPVISPILTNPGSVFKVADLPTDATHYIYSGNTNNAYSISSGAIYGDPAKIQWNTPTSANLVVHGLISGNKIGRGVISVPTGDSWYAGDSLFAWSTIDDTDTAAVNPLIGNTLAKVSTGAAVASGGLWDMDNAAYSGTGLTGNLIPSKPIFVAAVLDKDNHTATYINALLSIGGGQGVSFQVNANVTSDIRAILAASNGTASTVFPTTTAGAHVYWLYSDGVNTVQCGVDQTNGTTVTTLALSASGAMGNNVVIGSNATAPRSLMKHGSMTVLNRAGLTLAQAKALVAKIQALHGIA